MSKVSKALGALLAVVFAGTVGATPLSALFAGGSLTVGDKLFDSWGLRGQGLIDTTGQVDLGLIDVTGSVSGTDVVLHFDAGNTLALTGDNLIDLFFGYRVSVLPGSGMGIVGAAFNLLQGSYGQDAFHAATEDIFDASNNALGHLDVEASSLNFQTSDSVAFSPVSEIFVRKNILLNGFAAGDSTQLNQFTQTFTQHQVPTPGTAHLLAAAGLAWLVTQRRRAPRSPGHARGPRVLTVRSCRR